MQGGGREFYKKTHSLVITFMLLSANLHYHTVTHVYVQTSNIIRTYANTDKNLYCFDCL